MFAFKSRNASYYIADPIASSTTIPLDAVIFVANNDMSSYSGISNWSFINISQSDGTPSYVRGTPTVSNAGSLYSRNMLSAFSTVSTGEHGGDTDWYVNSLAGTPKNQAAINDTNAGAHSHAITNLQSTANLGGKYHTSAVVGLYKCVASTVELPKSSLIFANSVQNLDFLKVDEFNSGRFDGCSLLSGSSSWVTSNATTNNGIYGESPSNFIINPTVGYSGTHSHSLINQKSLNSSGASVLQTIGYNAINNSAGYHNHSANNMIVSASPKIKYFKAYKAIKNTGVYYGMILG